MFKIHILESTYFNFTINVMFIGVVIFLERSSMDFTEEI
jgi:hypothetical protein